MIARWIGRNVYVEISNEACEALSSFTLMWHFVERKFKDNRIIGREKSLAYKPINKYLIRRSRRIIDNVHLRRSSEYFQARYSPGGAGQFAALGHHNDQERECGVAVERMLQGDRTTEEHARCVAYICWRIRNNIFHGNKNFNEIATQADLIKAAAEGLQGIAIALGLARDFED